MHLNMHLLAIIAITLAPAGITAVSDHYVVLGGGCWDLVILIKAVSCCWSLIPE
jgi:hypothetical protein